MKPMGRKMLIAGSLLAAVVMAGQAAAVEFVHGSWPPAVAHFNRVTLPQVFKEIEAETKGEVVWKLVPGGQLAKPAESFQATSDNIIQGALGISTYVPNLVPSLNTIYSTIVFESDVVVATGASLETFHLECPSCIAEFKKINIVPMAGWTSSQYYLACREPFKSLADLKGKKIRATGGYSELWQLGGAVPVHATLPEAVGLLQKGGLDCTNGVHNWLKTFSYADFAKNLINYPTGLSGPAIGMMMNREAWQKLSTEQKVIHLKKSAFISALQALGDFTADNDANLKFVMENKGLKLIEPDKAGFDELTVRYDEEQRKANISNAKGFGVADPAAIIDSYAKNVQKWTELTKDLPRTRDAAGALSELIWTHVYSKVDPNSL